MSRLPGLKGMTMPNSKGAWEMQSSLIPNSNIPDKNQESVTTEGENRCWNRKLEFYILLQQI